MTGIRELFETGGVTLVAILLMSVLALFVLIERLIATHGILERARAMTDHLIKLLYSGELEQARSACSQAVLPPGPMFGAALTRVLQNRSGADAALERERQQFNQWLRRRLWLLGTIGASAPFVGLFGTVIGIMQSFADIADTGGGGFAVVSRGLSEALVATAAGIIVAVEAVIFYNFLQARLGKVAFGVKLAGEEFLECLSDRSRWSEPRIDNARKEPQDGNFQPARGA